MADTVDHILANVSDTTDRDRELRQLLAKYAPCPVEGAQWSLVNALDYDFTGFNGKHLSTHTTTHTLLDIARINNNTPPSIEVLRDMCLAAKLAYEDPKVVAYTCQAWNMTTTPELFFSVGEAQAFIMYDQQNIVLSFRGTELINAKDWHVDFSIKLVRMTCHATDGANPDEAAKKPLAHAGFLGSLGLVDLGSSVQTESLYAMICGVLNLMLSKHPNSKIWVTGHSMGAALASLFVAQLLLDNDQLLDALGGLYTFGQPRTGDDEYAKLFSELIDRGLVYRVVNKKDLFTKLPFQIMDYASHGCKVTISGKELVIDYPEEKVVLKKTHKTALAPNSTMKKIVTALLPKFLEDHYPSEYSRSLQIFL